MSKPKLGNGQRFEKLKNKLAHEPSVENPEALAASIAREKYGDKKVQEMAVAGKRRKGNK